MCGRRVLLGIHLGKQSLPLIGKIHRFKVFDAGEITDLPPDDRKRNRNYQIEGDKNEKLVMRVFYLDDNHIRKILYYSLPGFDQELEKYLVLEQLSRLLIKSKLHDKFKLTRIEWKMGSLPESIKSGNE